MGLDKIKNFCSTKYKRMKTQVTDQQKICATHIVYVIKDFTAEQEKVSQNLVKKKKNNRNRQN